jgi:hypothetical protein
MLPGQSAPDIAPVPSSSPVDGVPCLATMSNNYHVHFHVTLFSGTTWYIIPMAIGMYQPQPDSAGDYTNNATCFDELHVHDHSGILHEEATTQIQMTLKQFLDEWGITLSPLQMGPFNGVYLPGPIRVFTTPYPYPQVNQPPSGPATEFTGDPNTIPLNPHEEITIFSAPVYGAGGNSIPTYSWTF